MIVHGSAAAFDRVARVVGGVVRETLRVTGTRAIVLLDAESSEGVLLARIADAAGIALTEYADPAESLTAHPANKTMLLVGAFFPRVDLLPLGDLYATEVAALSDGWTGDEAVNKLAKELGGIGVLDRALQRHIDGREHLDDLADLLDEDSRRQLQSALQRTWFRRGRAGLVPKLGTRTIGIDLLD